MCAFSIVFASLPTDRFPHGFTDEPRKVIAATEDFDFQVLGFLAVYDDTGVPLVEGTLHLGGSPGASSPDAFNSGFSHAAHNPPRSALRLSTHSSINAMNGPLLRR
jgi:hypothetical protein